jgi:ribosomal protein S18 acetylase RimI-like enzyme
MSGLAPPVRSAARPFGEGPAPTVVRVSVETRERAAARLLGVRFGAPEAAHLIEQAQAEGTDTSLMWAWVEPGEPDRPLHVAMACPGPGRTMSLFLSPDGPDDRLPEYAERARAGRAAAIRAACAHFTGRAITRAPEVHLAQALLEPDQTTMEVALVDAGFERLATLDYLRRELPRRATTAPTWPADVTVRSMAELGVTLESTIPANLESIAPGSRSNAPSRSDDAWSMLARALQASYEQTLDCPALCGLRDMGDVLLSHRSVGAFDPALWFVVLRGDVPLGCMLLSPCPAQDAVELVYLGIGPALRGQGLGASLLNLAFARLSGRGERSFACAVDRSNAPAMKLYHGARFRAFTSRVAMVRSLRNQG